MNFANNLTYLINNNVLSAASILKITKHESNGLISMWKSGERQPKVKDVLALANFLNVTMDDLVVNDIATVLSEKKESNPYKEKYDLLNSTNKELANKMIDTLYNQENK